MINRRTFVSSGLALPAALSAFAAGTSSAPQWIFLGTDQGKGIYRARWNQATGEIGKAELAVQAEAPAFFAMHPSLPMLYSGNHGAGENAGVSSYRVDHASGTLTPVNWRGTHGDAPCFVSVDATGQSAYAANYGGGSLTAFQLGRGGELTQTIGVFRYNQAQHGPVSGRQDAAHLHCATISPGNGFVLVCDLGDDVLLLFPIAPGPQSSVGQPSRVAARPGSGPRHVSFHPNARWVYCIHELDCTIDLYDWKVAGGQPAMTLREASVLSTLAPGASMTGNTACELVISDDGRFAYACTRGVDQITVYRIDPSTGLLTEQQRLSCGGKVPRYIGFDPSRRWLVSCNQGAPGSVTVFACDAATGKLRRTPKTCAADSPAFCLWV